ncbi:MAG: c-type cytochrome domain-containing protein [Pseudomonadota bacterium]|nr:c-type cytochrome domain-containing protein [Pseudomonadota bacterium]
MRWGSVASMVSLLVLGFTYGNCQKKTDGSSSQSSLSCEGNLKEAFKTSYYPWARSKCAMCHVANAPAPVGSGRGFGDQNLSLAFKDFYNFKEPNFRAKALDPGHQSGLTGPQNEGVLAGFRTKWEKAETIFKNCVLARNGGQPEPAPINTTSKPIARPATIKFNNPARSGCKNAQGVVVAACILADADYARITWNLGTDLMPNANNPNLAGITFDIEVAIADYSPDAPTAGRNYFYYHFRRPRITNAGSSNLLVGGLTLKLNGEAYTDGTTFTMLNQIVNAGSPIFTLNNETLAMGGSFLIVPGSDSVSISFTGTGPTTLVGGITTPPPPPPLTPTFTQLFGVGGSVRGSCINCHGAAVGQSGNFRIDTYLNVLTGLNGTGAKVIPGNAAASRIIIRMESLLLVATPGQSVMPPNPNPRVLQTEINRVRAWINAGAPND